MVAVVAVVVAVREGEGLLPGKGAVFLWWENEHRLGSENSKLKRIWVLYFHDTFPGHTAANRPFEYWTINSPLFRLIRYSGVRYLDG